MAKAKLLYTNILQESSKQLKIAGEIQWQKLFPSIDFRKIIQLRLMTTCINVQITLTLTVTTADIERTIYISLQNAQE